ncbi:MAG: uracil-DNA glycosylase [Bacillota bacterium]
MDNMHELHQQIAACQRCERLRTYCREIARTRVKRYRDQEYWGRPVPGFGDPAARLYILGLAPGAHGANRTGRMFTGDDSGLWLYGALHQFGFANQPESHHRDDGLALTGAYIGNAARCAPPDNKPLPAELEACRPFLEQELALLPNLKVVLALGKIAFDAYLKLRRQQGYQLGRPTFAHGAEYPFDGLPTLLCSYHPSRQNTNTGVLTRPMWEAIFQRARQLAES